MQQALQILQQIFGYKSFRPGQQEIIQQLLDGQDAIVLMPTGGGKSLCYQIPSMVRKGVGIIVSPLIALMQDQMETLVQNGIKAACLNSTLSSQEQYQTRQQALNNELDLLYVSPERLLHPSMTDFLYQLKIALFAIDEAHCVSQWGHDFRPEYQQLAFIKEEFPHTPVIALTATADQETRKEIQHNLKLDRAKWFISGFDRPNIHYQVSQGSNGRQALLRFLQENHKGDSGIVYCLSRKKVEQTAQLLCEQGYDARPYHAGMSNQQRKENQQHFIMQSGVIIVATIAFGMGIDKPDVRFVAHLSLPKSIESYYQETGRAGRDGLPANAFMHYGLQDVLFLRKMLEEGEASKQRKQIERHKLEAMLGYAEITSCRRISLLGYFDEHHHQPCGNCDNCINPPKTLDMTQQAQKALSCIYKTGQIFGVNYLIDILHGKDDARIKRNEHDKISTFAIGKEIPPEQWRNIFRLLIAQGLVRIEPQGGGLMLDDKCRPLLRGEQTFHIRQQSKRKKSKKSSKQNIYSDNALWLALKNQRQKLAEEQDVPPYAIFHDATLMEMMEKKPGTMTALSRIHGIGEHKLKLYGQIFLDIIRNFSSGEAQQEKQQIDTTEESVLLFKSGMNMEQIAQKRSLTVTTINNHLAKAIRNKQISLSEVIALSDDSLQKIMEEFIIHSQQQPFRLRPVYEGLGEKYPYETLNLVKAHMDAFEML